MQPPFDNSYWIIDRKFLAGHYPGSLDEAEADKKLQGLVACGIRFVINLMEEHELDHNGNQFISYVDRLNQFSQPSTPIQCIRIPIRDMDVPRQAVMRHILDEIDRSMHAELPVYVHCWGGLGRTGTVVGCYLARHQIATGQAALEKINHLRRNTKNAAYPSPQTHEQRALICAWQVGR